MASRPRPSSKADGGRLGDFGTVHEVTHRTFGYFGLEVRLNPQLSELSFVDFMERATTIDETDPTSVTIIKDFMGVVVEADDFAAFWATALANRQTTADLLKMVSQVVEAMTERPTGRGRGSSTGQGRTAAKSRATSFDRALAATAGRPDLQLAVVRARRERQAG